MQRVFEEAGWNASKRPCRVSQARHATTLFQDRHEAAPLNVHVSLVPFPPILCSVHCYRVISLYL
jgi:hypothetical protein